MYCLTNVLFFDIPWLYYYINFISSILFCLFYGDVYLSLGICYHMQFVTGSELFFCKVFEILVILLKIRIRSPVCFFCFLNCSFWYNFMNICCGLIFIIKTFLATFTTQDFTYIFTTNFIYILAEDKNPLPFANIKSLGWAE